MRLKKSLRFSCFESCHEKECECEEWEPCSSGKDASGGLLKFSQCWQCWASRFAFSHFALHFSLDSPPLSLLARGLTCPSHLFLYLSRSSCGLRFVAFEIGRTPPARARAFTVSTQQEVLRRSISVSLFCDILESLVTSCEISWSYWGRILHVFNHVFKFSMMTLIDVLWYVQRLKNSKTAKLLIKDKDFTTGHSWSPLHFRCRQDGANASTGSASEVKPWNRSFPIETKTAGRFWRVNPVSNVFQCLSESFSCSSSWNCKSNHQTFLQFK